MDYIKTADIEKTMAVSYIGSQVMGRKVGRITKKTLTFIITGTLVILVGILYWVLGFLKGFQKKA